MSSYLLSITGSDSTGGSGIQADIRTCNTLGGHALSVVTAVTVQNSCGILSLHPMDGEVVGAQLQGVMRDYRPVAAKVGMLCTVEVVQRVADALSKVPNVVVDTAFITSRGERIADAEVIDAVCRQLMPMARIVIIQLAEASMLLHWPIVNEAQMRAAAAELLRRYGMGCVIVQGTHRHNDLCRDLWAMPVGDGDVKTAFYTLPDFTQRDTHGLASTLSAAVATMLALHHDVPSAIDKAYRYLQSLTVHAATLMDSRRQELYNAMMQQMANHFRQQHDVAFYANVLNITPRYLAQVTMAVCGKSPKQIIAEELADEVSRLLVSTTLSIQEIALMLGFSSQSQLTRLYRRVKGVSPSSVRNA